MPSMPMLMELACLGAPTTWLWQALGHQGSLPAELGCAGTPLGVSVVHPASLVDFGGVVVVGLTVIELF